MILYAATTNPGKLREFAESASSAGVTVLALPGLAAMPEPVEDADSFSGNAEIKARAYSLAALAAGEAGVFVFADDSGLAVDALGGRPGVRSARFAEDCGFDPSVGSKDERNNRCVLSLMPKGAPRGARFVCALALARDGEIVLRAEGEVRGELLPMPRGEGGFGYDPLFLLPELGLTAAELPAAQKWELSHRGRAFRGLLAQLAPIAV